MNRILPLAAFFLVLLVLRPAFPADIGSVKDLTGKAFVTRAKEAAKPLSPGDAIQKNDTIETAEKSRLRIVFTDGTDLVVASRGRLLIDDFVFNADKPAENRARLRILGGAFSYISGLIGKSPQADVSLTLDYGAIGIRGTRLLGALKGGLNWIYLETGKVEVSNAAGNVSLDPGEGTSVSAAGTAPRPPHAWSEEEIDWIHRAVNDPDADSGALMAQAAPARGEAKAIGGAGPAARAAKVASPASEAIAPAAPPPPPAEAEAGVSAPATASAPAPADIWSAARVSPDAIGTKITGDGEDGMLRVQAAWPVTVNIATVDLGARKLDDTALQYQAQLKGEGLEGTAYLEMWVHLPDGKGGWYFARGLDSQLLPADKEWKEVRTSFLLKQGQVPDKAMLNLVINGSGAVLVRDLRLSH